MKVLIKTKEQLENTPKVHRIDTGWRYFRDGTFFNDEMINLCGKMIEVQELYKPSKYQYKVLKNRNNWLIAGWMIAPNMNRNGANG